MVRRPFGVSFFFFNDTATTEIYTLSLHDALPIWVKVLGIASANASATGRRSANDWPRLPRTTFRRKDRKSTRLNSSHSQISYAVFCLKKKKHRISQTDTTKTRVE